MKLSIDIFNSRVYTLYMSKNNIIKVDKESDFVRIYQYVNFGSVVDVFGKKAVVTEFDPSVVESNTKVVYKEGGFDWMNRDDLEDEQERVNNLTSEESEGDDFEAPDMSGASEGDR